MEGVFQHLRHRGLGGGPDIPVPGEGRAHAEAPEGQLFQKPALRAAPLGGAAKPGAVSVLCGLLPVLRRRPGLLPLPDHLHSIFPGHHGLRHRAGRGADPGVSVQCPLWPLDRSLWKAPLCRSGGCGNAGGARRHVLCPQPARRHDRRDGDDVRLHDAHRRPQRQHPGLDAGGQGGSFPGHPHDLPGAAAHDHRPRHRRGADPLQPQDL